MSSVKDVLLSWYWRSNYLKLHQRRSFPLRISSVNVTKFAGNCALFVQCKIIFPQSIFINPEDTLRKVILLETHCRSFDQWFFSMSVLIFKQYHFIGNLFSPQMFNNPLVVFPTLKWTKMKRKNKQLSQAQWSLSQRPKDAIVVKISMLFFFFFFFDYSKAIIACLIQSVRTGKNPTCYISKIKNAVVNKLSS